MADPPPLGLSEQDETKLLADYGVVGPYDRLVEVQAASKFKSDYGDDNVFLTGAVDVDDDDEGQDHLPDTDLDAREELLLPLDALLVKHTNILGAYSSNTLMTNISSALQSAEAPSTTPEAEKANIQYREVLRQGREQEARANYLTSEVGKATTGGMRRASVQRRSVMDLGDDEGDTVGEANKLLEAANLFLAQEKYNPDLDTELQGRLKEIREEQEQTADLTSDDDSDEEEDEELLKARALISKFAAIKEAALAEEETSAESVEEPNPNDAVGREEPSVPPPLPELVYPLYSYDYEPSKEMATLNKEWEAVETGVTETQETPTTKGEESKDEAVAEPPAVTEKSTDEILASIETMAQRDQQLETNTRKALKAQYTEIHKQISIVEQQKMREREGLVSLDDFASRMNKLLPTQAPPPAPVPLSNTDKPAPNLPQPVEEEESIESIQKKAKREMFFSHLQMKEYQRMKEEDARVQRYYKALEERYELCTQRVSDCLVECDKEYTGIVAEEAEKFTAIQTMEAKDLNFVKQKEKLRAIQATQQMLTNVMEEYNAVIHHTTEMEEEEFKKIGELFLLDFQAVTLLLEQQQAKKREEDLAYWNKCVESFNAGRATARPDIAPHRLASVTQQFEHQPVCTRACAMVSSVEAVLELYNVGKQWTDQNRKLMAEKVRSVEDTLSYLRVSARAARTVPPPSTAMNSRPTTADRPATSSAQENSLDEKKFRAVQSLALNAAEKDPSLASQIFSHVSFALEHIDAIHYEQLRQFQIKSPVVKTGARQSTDGSQWFGERLLAVCELVHELDLGSNALTELSLMELLRTFPQLSSLKVNDNKIDSLHGEKKRAGSALRGVMAAQENAITDMTKLRRLDVSSNCLKDLTEVGKYLHLSLLKLTAHANQLTNVEALLPCTRLMSLILNRNAISTLGGLSALHALTELNVSDNQLTTLEHLAPHHFLLEKILASNNSISAVFGSSAGSTAPMVCFPFLTQLFLNNNNLKEISSSSFVYLPLLSILYAENNKISDVGGLRCCPRLTTLKLAFNQLKDWNALNPVLACTRLTTLDLSENPLIKGDNAKAMLLACFPQLRELNNEAVPHDTIKKGDERALSLAKSFLTHHFSSPVSAFAFCYPRYSTDMSCLNRRYELESHATGITRSRHIAEATEESLRQRLMKTEKYIPTSAYLISTSIEENGRREHLQILHDALLNVVHHRPVVFTKNVAYGERLRKERERVARYIVSDWMYGLVLIKRARAELRALFEERKESDAYKREMAVRKIQPVWRGAALRSRLKRALKVDDDDNEYEAVELDFGEFDDGTDRVGDLLKKVLDLSKEPLENFNVPLPIVKPPPSSSRVGAASDVLSFERPDSAPLRTIPREDPAPGRPSSMQVTTESAPNDLEAAWGAQVAGAIRKKKKKMDSVHQSHVRNQFMNDPLKAKKMR